MLNLFIAVIVNAVQAMHDEEHKAEIDAEKATQAEILEQLKAVQSELHLLRSEIKTKTSTS
jgi:voltage-gated sodium channel